MKRHPVDSVSLVFALLFSAAVAWWGVAMLSRDPLNVPAAWIGAGTLLVIGLVGLVSALRPQRATVEAPLTVPPAPQPALDPDPYNDPFLASMSLPRVDGVLDADAIAAAYREAGFEDPVPVSGPGAPTATAIAERPTDTTRVEPTAGEPAAPTAGEPAADAPAYGRAASGAGPADRKDSVPDVADRPTDVIPAADAGTADVPLAERPARSERAERPTRAGDTKELPADPDGRTTS